MSLWRMRMAIILIIIGLVLLAISHLCTTPRVYKTKQPDNLASVNIILTEKACSLY